MTDVRFHAIVIAYIIARKCMTQRRRSRHVDTERIYGRRPKPLCPPHLITLQYYSLLRFFVLKLATTSGSLQLHVYPEIIGNAYVI